MTWEAEGICSYDLRPEGGGEIDEFQAGAHVDLDLPIGLVRSYSLLNAPTDTSRYLIGVQKSANSRGGSKWVHQNLHAGDLVIANRPRNNFRLADEDAHSVFIAGGIGITPIISMVQELRARSRTFTVYYSARTSRHAAFLGLLDSLCNDDPRCDLKVTFDQEPGGVRLDLNEIVANLPGEAHVYCCGPSGMLAAFEAVANSLSPERVHLERFSSAGPKALEGGFQVNLARSHSSVFVEPGLSILDAIIKAGFNPPYSCKEGVCGTCEAAVLAGEPDHRDLVLTEDEKKTNRTMMICCSGSKSSSLTLDI